MRRRITRATKRTIGTTSDNQSLSESLSEIDLLTTREAAAFLRMSERTLEDRRQSRVGPAFLRQQGRVFYRRRELRIWQDARTVRPPDVRPEAFATAAA